jgi:single-stranded-DNA-specific exonuclease
MAAGLTMDWDKVGLFQEFLAEALGRETEDSAEEARALSIDALAAPEAVTLSLVDALERVGPFGAGHPDPVLALPNLKVRFSKRVGDKHLRLALEDSRGKAVRAIAFNCADEPLGEALQVRDAVTHVAVRIKRNVYQGQESVGVEVVDAAPASP